MVMKNCAIIVTQNQYWRFKNSRPIIRLFNIHKNDSAVDLSDFMVVSIL